MRYILLLTLLFSSALLFAQQADTARLMTYVERMPRPQYDMNKYLSKHMDYPRSARRRKAEGRVVVKFMVSEMGDISEVTISKHVDDELDSVAVLAVRSMPRWVPGMQNGKAVKVYYTLPLTFKLH